jgi:hypothetical protein
MKTFMIWTGIIFISGSFMRYADPDYSHFKKDIAIGTAQHIKTQIDFSAGELLIQPLSSGNLCEGEFTFYKSNKPEISYEENNYLGSLQISDSDFHMEKDNKTQWVIDFNKKVTCDFFIAMKAGRAEIDLTECNLQRFDFEIGAGSVHINLKNTSVADVKFSGGAGEMVMDLSGEWKNDLDADISGGVGEITIILPHDIGIELSISGILGDRNVPGFYKDGSTYTNDLFGETKHTLYLDIAGGIGSVNIKTAQ